MRQPQSLPGYCQHAIARIIIIIIIIINTYYSLRIRITGFEKFH